MIGVGYCGKENFRLGLGFTLSRIVTREGRIREGEWGLGVV